MKRQLLYLLVFCTSLAMAQTNPMGIYWNSHLDLNFTHYDSVYIMSDTTGGALLGTARFQLLNDRYVTEGVLLDQWDSVRFYSDTSSAQISIYETDFHTGDTNQVHLFYRNASGQDTAYEIIGPRANFYTGPREFRELFYNSKGLLDSFYVKRLSLYGNLTDASGLNYYYTGALIDSITSKVYSGNGMDRKYVFLRNNQGEIEHEEYYADLGQGMAYHSRYEYLYNAFGQVDEVRHFYYNSQDSSYSIGEVYYYLKRAFFETPETQAPAVKVFPNPAHDVLQVQTTSANGYCYQIYGVRGNEVAAGQGGDHINVSGLTPGVYFLKLTTPNFVTIKKILVQ